MRLVRVSQNRCIFCDDDDDDDDVFSILIEMTRTESLL
jgi:hypothetical protein